MYFGFDNEHEVLRGSTTLNWGTLAGNPILAKTAGYFYNHISEFEKYVQPISSLKSYEPKHMGYVVIFAKDIDGTMKESQTVILVPEASYFVLDENWLTQIGCDVFISTEQLVEAGLMEIFADVFVSYVPARSSIVPVVWKIADVSSAHATFGIESPYGVALYNDLKEALPAVDLETDPEARWGIVEYFSNDTTIHVVFNRNHSAFNGTAPRDIIMKPVLAIFAHNDRAFFNGDTDEIAVTGTEPVEPDIPNEGFMNPPEGAPIEDKDKTAGSFDAAMDILGMK